MSNSQNRQAKLFAIATFRAGILPRWAAGLLVLETLMISVGLGMAWMGYALSPNAGRNPRKQSLIGKPSGQKRVWPPEVVENRQAVRRPPADNTNVSFYGVKK